MPPSCNREWSSERTKREKEKDHRSVTRSKKERSGENSHLLSFESGAEMSSQLYHCRSQDPSSNDLRVMSSQKEE